MLPEWIPLCSEKGQTENMKDGIITEHLQKNKVYHDVEAPITAPFLKTVRQEKQTGGHTNFMEVTAATGLLVHAVKTMTEEEVVDLN
eukprot:11799865-Ditylum_brightwellii.AAC.1